MYVYRRPRLLSPSQVELGVAFAVVTQVRVGVMGAGSVGCYVGGLLAAQQSRGIETRFVGRDRVRSELATHGLTLQSVEAPSVVLDARALQVDDQIASLAHCDVVLVCVKCAQTSEVAAGLSSVIASGTIVVSLQNGVGNAALLSRGLPRASVVPAIVDFNVVSRGGGVFRKTTSGALKLQRTDDARLRRVIDALLQSGQAVTECTDTAAHQWTKLIVNLNNAVSALSGASTTTLLASRGYRRIMAAVMNEGVAVLRAAGIAAAPLRGVPLAWSGRALLLPTALLQFVSAKQMQVDPEARSSMSEDIRCGRPTEIDFLNGEIVRLAARFGVPAPLNARLVELVRAAEAAGQGSPLLDATTLSARLR